MKRIILFLEVIFFLLLCGCYYNKDIQSNHTDSDKSIVAKNEELTYGDYTFQLNNNAIKITGFFGNKKDIIIPSEINSKEVKAIADNAFYQQTELSSIVLPQTIEKIGDNAFYRCYSLREIVVPKSVKRIDSNPFFRCSSLESIFVDDGNPYYSDKNGVLFSKDGALMIAYPEGSKSESYIVPKTVKRIADDAFGYYCEHLRTLTIPSSVLEMPDYNIFIYYDEITLMVESNSAAEDYAIKHKIKFKTIAR